MENSKDSWLAATEQWLVHSRGEKFPPALSETIAGLESDDLERLLETIIDSVDEMPLDPPAEHDEVESADRDSSAGDHHAHATEAALHRLRWLLQMMAARVLRLRLEQPSDQDPEAIINGDSVVALATRLADISPLATAHCLQILAAQGDTNSLDLISQFLKQQQLVDDQAVAVALSPLFQWPPKGLAELYTLLGEDVWQWQLLGPMLDLAGHSLRRGKLDHHPLEAQRGRLRELLAATIGRLAKLAENPMHFGDDVPTIQRVLSNAVALSVSLCDTLGLIRDEQAEGALNQALALGHRRVQTEAAGALARLDKPAGKQRLIELAADPAARLRALAYLEELAIDDASLNQWRAPQAIAEAEAVAWLADRERFGVPPAELELIDERTQFWPSYEQPQNCCLFQFTYHFPPGQFANDSISNLIIAGPLVHAFQADLRSMEVDDVYSLFAGWQAEHEEIYEVPSASFNSAQRNEAQRLTHSLTDQEIEEVQVLALTFFFGERAILAIGTREGEKVCAVSDGSETLIVPIDSRPTSLSPELVLAMYRGRKLLRTFN